MQSRIDCLLVHSPKFRNYYPPMNSYSSTNRMSQSLLGLADSLNKSGLKARVLHMGVEKLRDRNFDIGQFVHSHKIPLVGISMHWHQQITDSLITARQIKSNNPESYLVLGGATASFFANDLLESYDFLDGVLTGEAEIPIKSLAEKIQSGKSDLGDVPNLVWRKEGNICQNESFYQASESDLNHICYTNLEYLFHFDDYIGFPKAVINTRLPDKINYIASKKMYGELSRVFAGLVIGRGCYVDCFYCAGGNRAQKLINHRHNVTFRSQEAVIRDIKTLISFGYTGSYVSFDPQPNSQAYYQELFSRMSAEKLNFSLIFSCWDLPTPEFIDSFSKTFADSKIAKISISPETGSEPLRKQSRGRYYSNKELLDILNVCEKHQVKTTVFFSLGIPRETDSDFQETIRLKQQIESKYHFAETTAFVIEMEPGSPWHLHPDYFGIRSLRTSLKDFIIQQNDPLYSPMFTTGYLRGADEKSIEDYERELLKLKCNNFCSQKKLCHVLRAAWGVSKFIGLTTTKDKNYQNEAFFVPGWRRQFEGH